MPTHTQQILICIPTHIQCVYVKGHVCVRAVRELKNYM